MTGNWPTLGVIDLQSGCVINLQSPITALKSLPFDRGFLVEDYAYASGSKAYGPRRILRLEVVDGRVRTGAVRLSEARHLHTTRTQTAWESGGHHQVATIEPPRLVDASPDGRTLILSGAAFETWIVTWPVLDIERVLSTAIHVGVDWERRLRFAIEPARSGRLLAEPLEGGPVRSVPMPSLSPPTSLLGRGIVQAAGHGLFLFDPSAGWKLTLLAATSRRVPKVSLSSDGRGLRTILGGVPHRFEVDLKRGTVLHEPPFAEERARARRGAEEGVWHPHADVVAYARHYPRVEVRAIDGSILCRLPDRCVPCAWVDDGAGLLIARDDEQRVELWCVPEA